MEKVIYKIIIIGFCFMPTLSNAATILDQSFTNGTALSAGFGQEIPDDPNFTRAQTFTVGVAGKLASAEFELASGILSAAATVQLNVLTTAVDGSPTSISLGSANTSIPAFNSQNPWAWYSIDLSALNIQVVANEVLALELSVLTPLMQGNVWWAGSYSSFPPTYPNGAAYYSQNGGPFVALDSTTSGADLTFKTFVDTSSVPEPSTMLLFGAGVAGLAGFVRRTRS